MFKQVVSAAIAMMLAACAPSASSDTMSGCYSPKKAGAANIKIHKDSGEYHASIKKQGVWKEGPRALVHPTEKRLSSIFGNDLKKVETALIDPGAPFGVFKFKDGTHVENKPDDTDYVAIVFIGGGGAYKTECN